MLGLQLVLLLLEQDPEPVPVELQVGLALLPLTLPVVYEDAKKQDETRRVGLAEAVLLAVGL